MLNKIINFLIKKLYKKSILCCNRIDKLCRMLNKQNTQDFINWQDALNKISVK